MRSFGPVAVPRDLPAGGPAFSLIEVVLAIGLFSFCIVSLIWLLGVALNSSRDSQRESSLAAALHSVDAVMHAIPTNTVAGLASTNLYFDVYGNLLTNSSSSYYAVNVLRVSPSAVATTVGVTNTTRLFLWKAQFSYPPPHFPTTNVFLLGEGVYDP